MKESTEKIAIGGLIALAVGGLAYLGLKSTNNLPGRK